MSIDHELRTALGRTDPPAGFRPRTVDRLASAEARPLPPARGRRRRPVAVLALAASLVVTVAGSSYLARRHAEREAERARRDVAIALEVVEHTLNDVRTRVVTAVRRTGVNHEHPSP